MKFKSYYWAIIAAASLVILAIAVPTFLLRGGDEPSANTTNPHTPEELEQFSKAIDYSPQIQAYTDLITANPGDTDAMRGLGDIYLQSGSLTEAREWYQKLVDASPSNAGDFLRLGIVYYEMGMKDISLRELQKGLNIDPNNQRILLEVGFIYNQSGNKDLANQSWKKAHDVNPSNEQGKMAQQLLEGKDPTQGP